MVSWDFVQNLGVGWNLGNTLDARVRGGKPKTTSEQETAWHNPVTTEEMIKTVYDKGFDILRIPTSWGDFLGDAPDYTVNRDWMNRVQEIVDYGLKYNMTIILNLHHEDWHFPSYENYPAASAIISKLWTQIANHFSDYDNRLIFEAMNEPRKKGTPVEWTGGDDEGRDVVGKLSIDFINAVRAAGGNNATRMLMIPTYAASSDEPAMKGFVMPEGENLIVSVHAYTPYVFALKEGEPGKWIGDYEKEIDSLFDRIDRYFLSKKIPVIMGECGARRKGDNISDRVQWASYYRKTAKKYGVPCIWWDNGSYDGDERHELFGLLNRRTCTWVYPEIADAFIG